jgi:6,7-dimethyl-8-ribityllumazine synthase
LRWICSIWHCIFETAFDQEILVMKDADKGITSGLDGSSLHIGVVQSRFNEPLTRQLADACVAELHKMGVLEDSIVHVTVPGALELGVALNAMASSMNFDALIALGCVIRGETYHFEIVANESAAAISRVAVDNDLPVINGVITTENPEQALARVAEKGLEAARAAVEMAHLLNDLSMMEQ